MPAMADRLFTRLSGKSVRAASAILRGATRPSVSSFGALMRKEASPLPAMETVQLEDREASKHWRLPLSPSQAHRQSQSLSDVPATARPDADHFRLTDGKCLRSFLTCRPIKPLPQPMLNYGALTQAYMVAGRCRLDFRSLESQTN